MEKKIKRKTQKDIGFIQGIIFTIDMMRINLVGHNPLEWIIKETSLTTKEIKKYDLETYKLWLDDPHFNDTLIIALKENDKRYKEE